MSKLETLTCPSVDSLTLSIQAPARLRFEGRITQQDPAKLLGGFLKSVHDAAIADKLSAFELDITELKFVNSSSIRLFLDWAGWVKNATPSYQLHILTSRKYTWQKTSFVAITALAAGRVEVRTVD